MISIQHKTTKQQQGGIYNLLPRQHHFTREIFLDVAWVQNNKYKIQPRLYCEIIVTHLDFTDCLILF